MRCVACVQVLKDRKVPDWAAVVPGLPKGFVEFVCFIAAQDLRELTSQSCEFLLPAFEIVRTISVPLSGGGGGFCVYN